MLEHVYFQERDSYLSLDQKAILALLIFSIKENLSDPQDSLIKYKAKAFFFSKQV